MKTLILLITLYLVSFFSAVIQEKSDHKTQTFKTLNIGLVNTIKALVE